jgi:hypothetical protein
MKIKRQVAMLFLGVVVITSNVQAQFNNPGATGWWRTFVTGTNTARGLAVGNLGTTPYPAAFQIHGELMPAGNNTPEVFRTNAPTTGNTFWRMFQGGTTAGFERGQLYAVPGQNHFNINAPNGRLQWHTQSVQRSGLNGTTSYTIGSFATQNKDGAMGLSPNNTLWANGPGPFSRLHLHDGTTSVLSAPYRPWMQNGITFTTNSDQMYIGHKVETGTDQTSAVIQWGDNDGPPVGPDVLKFLFTGAYTNGDFGVAGLNGRELARFHPLGFFGIGDWQSIGLQPLERLDILDGRVKVRELPTNPEGVGFTKVLVVDDSSPFSPEYGVIKWRDASTLGGADCDWVVNSNEHVVTAFNGMFNNGNACEPDDGSGVGIGNSSPKAKLDVYYTGSLVHGLAGNLATSSEYRNTSGGTAVRANAATLLSNQFATGFFHGVHGLSGSAPVSYGVLGEAAVGVNAPSNATEIAGVVGRANGNDKAATVIGVLGSASGATNSANNWAGYFDGNVQITGQLWNNSTLIFSDEALKTDVTELTSAQADALVGQLVPRRYQYNAAEYSTMHFPETPQLGFLAQEVEEVLPELVGHTVVPASIDSVGNVLTPSMEVSGVNYIGVIPVLVGSMNHQRAEVQRLNELVEEQTRRLEQLEAALASCCAATPGDTRLFTTPPANTPDDLNKALEGDPRHLYIQPNPFTERTTLHYRLERAGRMQLLANSADGKALKVLQEASLEAGAYQYNWETNDLTPGVYYVTLLLDGEPLVKKAVKVMR